jgi:biopolymer transport protein ExbB/TolQ
MNPITDQFFMRVARVDARTNRMYDVTIYDLRKGPERQTIFSDSGVFLLDAKGENLQLQLMDGHAQEFVRGDPKRLQRTFFRTQTVQLRGIVQQFEATAEDNYRGDREQTVCQMHQTYIDNAKEFTRLRQQAGVESDAIMEGAQRAMRVALSREEEYLEKHLPFLATVGSISPYIGLFGTVWGIMNSLRGLSSAHQATLAMVAPGISEALVATAMGLFAAIPAVIFYNRFSSEIDRLSSRYEIFLEEFSAILQRQVHV